MNSKPMSTEDWRNWLIGRSFFGTGLCLCIIITVWILIPFRAPWYAYIGGIALGWIINVVYNWITRGAE